MEIWLSPSSFSPHPSGKHTNCSGAERDLTGWGTGPRGKSLPSHALSHKLNLFCDAGDPSVRLQLQNAGIWVQGPKDREHRRTFVFLRDPNLQALLTPVKISAPLTRCGFQANAWVPLTVEYKLIPQNEATRLVHRGPAHDNTCLFKLPHDELGICLRHTLRPARLCLESLEALVVGRGPCPEANLRKGTADARNIATEGDSANCIPQLIPS